MNCRSIDDMIRNELKNYTKYLRYKVQLEDQIENLWYELGGVKGVRYDKLPSIPNPSAISKKKLALIDKLDHYQSELTRVNLQIRYLDAVLDRLPVEDSKLVRYVLIEGHTLIEAGEQLSLTNTAVSKRIDTALKKAVDGTFNNKPINK